MKTIVHTPNNLEEFEQFVENCCQKCALYDPLEVLTVFCPVLNHGELRSDFDLQEEDEDIYTPPQWIEGTPPTCIEFVERKTEEESEKEAAQKRIQDANAAREARGQLTLFEVM